jgi:hypothetical protein
LLIRPASLQQGLVVRAAPPQSPATPDLIDAVAHFHALTVGTRTSLVQVQAAASGPLHCQNS